MAGQGTPATTAARQAGIRFRLHAYPHDPSASSYGLEAAQVLQLAPERVFKTLVASVDGRLTLAMVPVARQVNLKALATVAGGKRATLADPDAAQRATGYVLGGISPLGQRSRLPAVLDSSALAHETVYVSAGRRGLELELAPADLARLTRATTGEIAA